MANDAFGLPEPDEAVPDFVKEEPQATDVEVPEEKVEELYPGRPEPAQAEERPRGPDGRFLPKDTPAPTIGSEEPPGETPEEPASLDEKPSVYAGKYADVPGLEKGYRELRDLQRRTAERANAYEQRVQEVEFQARQMEDAVKKATEYVRSLQTQQQQQPQQPVYDEMGRPVQLPPQQPQWTPDQIQPMVEAQMEQRFAAQAQAMQEQQWKQEKYLEAKAAQSRFFESHPEVLKDSDADEDIANTILAFNEAWQPMDGSSFNLGSEESLAIAYEASQRPALRSVLMKQPSYMDDDDGMNLARALADQIDGRGREATQAAPVPAGRMQPRPNTPFAERGSSPAQPQATPLDEFDQAVAEYRGINKSRGSKTFFGE